MVVFSIPFKLFCGCILNQVKMGNERLRNTIVQWVTIIIPRCYKGAEHDFTTCDMFLGQHLCWLWNNIVIGKRLGSVEPLKSDFAAVGTNCWFVWAWFLQRFFFSILSPMKIWFLAAVASGMLGDTSFTVISPTWLHRYYLNWTEMDDAITKFNNENWVLNLVILHYWQYFSYFDIVQLLYYNLYC